MGKRQSAKNDLTTLGDQLDQNVLAKLKEKKQVLKEEEKHQEEERRALERRKREEREKNKSFEELLEESHLDWRQFKS